MTFRARGSLATSSVPALDQIRGGATSKPSRHTRAGIGRLIASEMADAADRITSIERAGAGAGRQLPIGWKRPAKLGHLRVAAVREGMVGRSFPLREKSLRSARNVNATLSINRSGEDINDEQ